MPDASLWAAVPIALMLLLALFYEAMQAAMLLMWLKVGALTGKDWRSVARGGVIRGGLALMMAWAAGAFTLDYIGLASRWAVVGVVGVGGSALGMVAARRARSAASEKTGSDEDARDAVTPPTRPTSEDRGERIAKCMVHQDWDLAEREWGFSTLWLMKEGWSFARLDLLVRERRAIWRMVRQHPRSRTEEKPNPEWSTPVLPEGWDRIE